MILRGIDGVAGVWCGVEISPRHHQKTVVLLRALLRRSLSSPSEKNEKRYTLLRNSQHTFSTIHNTIP